MEGWEERKRGEKRRKGERVIEKGKGEGKRKEEGRGRECARPTMRCGRGQRRALPPSAIPAAL